MKRGFTILELLVASMLLGMLVTVLTQMFSQSSISWRTGVAGVVDMDEVRMKLSQARDEADNAYIWGGNTRRVLGLWDGEKGGRLRERAVDADGEYPIVMAPKLNESSTLSSFSGTPVNASGNGDNKSSDNYIVVVRSAGPDRDFNTRYDNIDSYPYEIPD